MAIPSPSMLVELEGSACRGWGGSATGVLSKKRPEGLPWPEYELPGCHSALSRALSES